MIDWKESVWLLQWLHPGIKREIREARLVMEDTEDFNFGLSMLDFYPIDKGVQLLIGGVTL